MGMMIKDVLPKRVPQTVSSRDSVADAARKMKQNDIGTVLVMDNGSMTGLLTDRDIVVRAIAEGRDPKTVTAGEICSKHLATLKPDDKVEHAVNLMRKKAIRRVPIVDGGRVVGVLSLGDLAIERDPDSALAGISRATPNT